MADSGVQRGLYTRNATGLVREAGLTDTMFFNWVAGGGVGLAIVYNVFWALNGFPGVDLVQSTLITLPFAIVAVLVFGLLASAIPRSGGDYVFVSRILHPAWGFVSSFTNFVSVSAYAGWVAWFASVAFVSGSAVVLAEVSGITALGDLATWAASPDGALIVGTLILAFSCGSMAIGLRFSLRAITIMAVVGAVGLIIAGIVLLLNGRDAFVVAFNAFAEPSLGAGAYDKMIAAGTEQGVVAAQGSAGFTTAILPAAVIAFYATGYSVWSIYFAGEFKGAGSRNRQLLSMIVPMLVNAVVFIGLTVLLFSVVGYEFLSASSYLYNYVPDSYGLAVPPFVNFFASLLSGNALLNVVIGVAWALWPIAMVLLIVLGFSRVLFAWSFDGILPRALSQVNERTHTPLKAILLSFVVSWTGLWLTINVAEFLTFLAFTLLLSLVFWMSTALAAVAFPYRLKTVYDASPARIRVGGIPLISILGAILAAWVGFEFISGLTVPGLFIPNLEQGLLVTGAVIGIGLVIFVVSWVVRRAQGIDPSYVYREIPPE